MTDDDRDRAIKRAVAISASIGGLLGIVAGLRLLGGIAVPILVAVVCAAVAAFVGSLIAAAYCLVAGRSDRSA
jgi:hypothetical protein